MAYTELIKHFQRVRHYMHEFYIYGFKDIDYYKGQDIIRNNE